MCIRDRYLSLLTAGSTIVPSSVLVSSSYLSKLLPEVGIQLFSIPLLLNKDFENMKLEYDYLSSTEKLLEFQSLYFDDELVKKDIQNSLKVLNPNGIILLHDCLPNNYYEQATPRCQWIWNGDVWKAIAELRINRSDLKIWTIDDDFGCGIIQRGESDTYVPKGDWNLWEYYNEHKYVMLNVVGTDHQVIKV